MMYGRDDVVEHDVAVTATTCAFRNADEIATIGSMEGTGMPRPTYVTPGSGLGHEPDPQIRTMRRGASVSASDRISRLRMLSTAAFVIAVTNTRAPNWLMRRIASQMVAVLPVPGMPCSTIVGKPLAGIWLLLACGPIDALFAIETIALIACRCSKLNAVWLPFVGVGGRISADSAGPWTDSFTKARCNDPTLEGCLEFRSVATSEDRANRES